MVIITAQNTFENAVEAMKRGALDYLVKPFGIAEVKALASKALRTRALEREVHELRREVGRRGVHGDRLVGKSAAMLEIFKTIGRVAARDVSVLITGDSGTGKELVARAIHAASGRGEGPFVAVNTAAIPRELLESELFGHERGAFTGAAASAEGALPRGHRGHPLPGRDRRHARRPPGEAPARAPERRGDAGRRKPAVQDRRAHHRGHPPRPRPRREAAGLSRGSALPPARRADADPEARGAPRDIRILAEHFIARYADELSDGNPFLPDETIAFLSEYDWPGNVRELENAIKRALVLASGDVLQPEDFAFLHRGRRPRGGRRRTSQSSSRTRSARRSTEPETG